MMGTMETVAMTLTLQMPMMLMLYLLLMELMQHLLQLWPMPLLVFPIKKNQMKVTSFLH